MSLSFDSIEELKALMKELLREVIDEEATGLHPPPAGDPVEPEPDGIGLSAVEEYFQQVSNFADEVNNILAETDYYLDSSTVYWCLAELIRRSYAPENGWIKSREWVAIADLLESGANDLADPRESAHQIPQVVADPVVWTNYLNLMARHWDPPRGAFTGRDAPSADAAPFHEKIARIKSMLIFFAYHGVIDREEWPWYDKVVNDLDLLYNTYKPDPVTGEMPPVSYPGG